ncbi:restriction endonuclease subunit S [Streptomyces sp. NPDC093269]|uniref:restriction endonuclease subunit S n=1 Tax=Streptomyces sp. NPDC093269 TaxID=3366038 RepID=UPI0037FAEB49
MSTLHRLDELCTIIMGQAPSGDSYNDEGLGWPLIAGAGDFGETLPMPKKYTTAASKLSRSGDIILGIRASIGDKVISDGEYCLGRGVAALRPNEKVDPRFLWQWLTRYAPSLAAKGRGATFKQVNRADIAEMPVRLPVMSEQLRIARALDRVDALRAKRRTAIALLEDLARSVFADMFEGYEGEGERWPLRSVEDVCTHVVDCVNRTAPTVDHETPYKMIRTTNVRNGLVDLSDVRYVDHETFLKWNRRLTPQLGDVLLTREAPVGEVGILRTDDQVFLGQRLMLYRVDPLKITAEYLLAAFRSSRLRRQFDKNSSGSTVKHLPLPVCRGFLIPVPPLDLQLRFEQIMKRIVELKSRHERQLAGLDALFCSVQHRAFSVGLTA